jgi:hypothetical protein
MAMDAVADANAPLRALDDPPMATEFAPVARVLEAMATALTLVDASAVFPMAIDDVEVEDASCPIATLPAAVARAPNDTPPPIAIAETADETLRAPIAIESVLDAVEITEIAMLRDPVATDCAPIAEAD